MTVRLFPLERFLDRWLPCGPTGAARKYTDTILFVLASSAPNDLIARIDRHIRVTTALSFAVSLGGLNNFIQKSLAINLWLLGRRPETPILRPRHIIPFINQIFLIAILKFDPVRIFQMEI
jgi:hypothetical protein